MLLSLNNIKKAYGEKPVLSGISLEIPDRGVFGIFGPSGCGKTTLLRIITGLEAADEGEIIGGEKQFSVVFQEDRLMPSLTAFENVAAVSSPDEAKLWLEKVGLGDSLDKYPNQLSGGMSRRAAIARALAFGGDCLVLDEPFKGLEPELKERIGEIICEYAQSKPVVLVTHDEYGRLMAENYKEIS